LDIFPINYPGLKIIHKNCEINKGIRQIEDSFRKPERRGHRTRELKGSAGKGVFLLPIIRDGRFM
jgi:hypothetical protein